MNLTKEVSDANEKQQKVIVATQVKIDKRDNRKKAGRRLGYSIIEFFLTVIAAVSFLASLFTLYRWYDGTHHFTGIIMPFVIFFSISLLFSTMSEKINKRKMDVQ